MGIEPNVRRAYVSDRCIFLETLSDDDDGIFYRYDKKYYVEKSLDDTLKIKIASDITDIDIISDEKLVFISAGDLYYWSKGEKKMIHSDVKTLKCGKESHGYERMFPIASQY